ncbi:MAG: hypothetical protein EOO12_00040 [Chitinophagaceae bacterium]|nr:MAG: hypothetical protein EOO12_00040 [Chitinophagaceae bacterium]
MTVSDSQFAAFVDRVMNCREAEDRAKADTKALYAEIADAGEDKTAIGQLVRELRVSEKDRIKANLRDAAVEDGRARYRRGKASHVRVREDEPEHDAETGEVKEPTTTNGGSRETAAAHPQSHVNIPGRRPSASGAAHDEATAKADELQRQPLTETHNEPAEGSAEETSAPIHPSEAALLPQTGGVETLVANSEAPDLTPSAPLRAVAATREDAGAGASEPTNITQLHKFNPATHFANSKGLPRLHGCLKPDACGGSHRALCHSCGVAVRQDGAA